MEMDWAHTQETRYSKKQSMTCNPQGKRIQGWPRNTWRRDGVKDLTEIKLTRDVVKDLTGMKLTWSNAEKISMDTYK